MIENSDLNDSALLPESNDSTAGASGGALGDASIADLKTGFFDADKIDKPDSEFEELGMPPASRGGFLNRPEGWER